MIKGTVETVSNASKGRGKLCVTDHPFVIQILSGSSIMNIQGTKDCIHNRETLEFDLVNHQNKRIFENSFV